jgi:hypothetical protein
MNYPAAELRGIKMSFYLINPDAEHRGILLIKLYDIRNIPATILWSLIVTGDGKVSGF